MISARRALLAMARDFFERELCEVYGWDSITLHAAEKLAVPEGRARHPLGKFRERVVIEFGPFRIEARSADDFDPSELQSMGRVELWYQDGLMVGGPLDVAIWNEVGRQIREVSAQSRAA